MRFPRHMKNTFGNFLFADGHVDPSADRARKRRDICMDK